MARAWVITKIMLGDAPDTVPKGHIGLFAAFILYFEQSVPNYRALIRGATVDDRRRELGQRSGKYTEKLAQGYEDAIDKAADEFRDALQRQEIAGLIREPRSGELEILSAPSWQIDPKSGAGANFLSNFVGPNDFTVGFGPETRKGGLRQPVFLETTNFVRWMSRRFIGFVYEDGSNSDRAIEREESGAPNVAGKKLGLTESDKNISEAIVALETEGKKLVGILVKTRDELIVSKLKQMGYLAVHRETISRYLKKKPLDRGHQPKVAGANDLNDADSR
ncbi:hypothetical protein [Lichenifustis flavocetrariae]|uniref:Uncharacterized protein n=1 Tax=Lichenifustis flavocetrariae TaxID=2949735 RepID=A0AA41Z1R8_9HYPH|nr:hypothetical protein [Lichenifustis flavocetrariae]MCW6512129.1 hypothetical protein [Lichenifustis flavocetrariae]